MKLLVLFAFIVLANCADKHEERWENWKLVHNKLFLSPKKENERKLQFVKNCDHIDDHNEKFAKGEVLFTKALNPVSDLTEEQFLARSTGVVIDPAVRGPNQPTITLKQTPPASLDLRTQAGVGPIRDQAACGSCWTFSTCATIEYAQWKKTSKFLDCAEQQLVDCTYTRSGCNGGWMDTALKYVNTSSGIAIEAAYPYKALYGTCQKSVAKSIRVDSKAPTLYYTMDENTVKNALNTKGVLTLCVDCKGWYQYKTGILSNATYYKTKTASCGHAIAIVGYGSENNIPYYIVRNSWNTWWGEKGYARLDSRFAAKDSYGTVVTNGGFMYQGIFSANVV